MTLKIIRSSLEVVNGHLMTKNQKEYYEEGYEQGRQAEQKRILELIDLDNLIAFFKNLLNFKIKGNHPFGTCDYYFIEEEFKKLEEIEAKISHQSPQTKPITSPADVDGKSAQSQAIKSFGLREDESFDRHKTEDTLRGKEFRYPRGHCWEGLTPKEVNEGYAKSKIKEEVA